ncbi:hypothetical protein PRZ48_012523 [Zasmidium cellare]|uniref:Uncharacterized protein n=1 Tax=Zasmidium cellare TaxID=395010 RepID=A0ABR0E618_ZASCE|nr:hypothetical protein PRZ48_012523 [Zasmidium cellare]
MADEDGSDHQQNCRLLALPGELKNRIYRLVLVQPEDTPIIITSTGYHRGGGLLQTCEQVRREALKIFFYENEFEHPLRRWNPTPMCNFMSTIARLELDCPKAEMVYEVPIEPCWRHLVQWCCQIHKGVLTSDVINPGALRKEDVLDLQTHMVAMMMLTVRTMCSQPWSLVEELLEGMRPSLITADRRWEDD